MDKNNNIGLLIGLIVGILAGIGIAFLLVRLQKEKQSEYKALDMPKNQAFTWRFDIDREGRTTAITKVPLES